MCAALLATDVNSFSGFQDASSDHSESHHRTAFPENMPVPMTLRLLDNSGGRLGDKLGEIDVVLEWKPFANDKSVWEDTVASARGIPFLNPADPDVPQTNRRSNSLFRTSASQGTKDRVPSLRTHNFQTVLGAVADDRGAGTKHEAEMDIDCVLVATVKFSRMEPPLSVNRSVRLVVGYWKGETINDPHRPGVRRGRDFETVAEAMIGNTSKQLFWGTSAFLISRYNETLQDFAEAMQQSHVAYGDTAASKTPAANRTFALVVEAVGWRHDGEQAHTVSSWVSFPELERHDFLTWKSAHAKDGSDCGYSGPMFDLVIDSMGQPRMCDRLSAEGGAPDHESRDSEELLCSIYPIVRHTYPTRPLQDLEEETGVQFPFNYFASFQAVPERRDAPRKSAEFLQEVCEDEGAELPHQGEAADLNYSPERPGGADPQLHPSPGSTPGMQSSQRGAPQRRVSAGGDPVLKVSKALHPSELRDPKDGSPGPGRVLESPTRTIGTINIQVVKAQGIPPLKSGRCNPYIRMFVRARPNEDLAGRKLAKWEQRQHTPVVSNNVNPDWENEFMLFRNVIPEDVLQIDVKDLSRSVGVPTKTLLADNGHAGTQLSELLARFNAGEEVDITLKRHHGDRGRHTEITLKVVSWTLADDRR